VMVALTVGQCGVRPPAVEIPHHLAERAVASDDRTRTKLRCLGEAAAGYGVTHSEFRSGATRQLVTLGSSQVDALWAR
jgi:hypothetical protein